jgi:signal transduction histidine kinase
MPETDDAAGRLLKPRVSGWRRAWRYGRAWLAPVLIWVLVAAALIDPLRTWVGGQDSYDQDALLEWLAEARNHDQTLPEMIDRYLRRVEEYARLKETQGKDGSTLLRLIALKREEIYQHLRALGEPPTQLYPGQLLLFPTIYRLEVQFDPDVLPARLREEAEKDGLRTEPVFWDSGLPTGAPESAAAAESAGQYQQASFALPRATVLVRYQLHAFNVRQRVEQEHARRLRQLGLLAVAATVLGLSWMFLLQNREREQERQRLTAQQKVHEAERLLLHEEARHAETERNLLEQRVAREAAERQALELKSHLYASISIMAGSYAHNIKNLLVRPNDLLRRCLEADTMAPDQEQMLREVQQTLGTVTERLQQILHTVRRDPGEAETRVLDLNLLLRGLGRTWRELAHDRWKLDVKLELSGSVDSAAPLWIAGDLSHLQQAVENLLFNARDATFEMRNHLREAAHRQEGLDPAARRQAVLSAAAWRGQVVLRTYRGPGDAGEEVVLEVSDNGAGMSEEVRQRCTEAHFSTKRGSALYEGHSTGMGLGLSFVKAILEHHRARLEIESEPLGGTTFRIRFAAAGPPRAD